MLEEALPSQARHQTIQTPSNLPAQGIAGYARVGVCGTRCSSHRLEEIYI